MYLLELVVALPDARDVVLDYAHDVLLVPVLLGDQGGYIVEVKYLLIPHVGLNKQDRRIAR